MFKTDIIKTYILEPNYYEYEKQNYYDILKIFNNNNLYLYLYIGINNNICYKNKQIKQNYIILSHFNYYNKLKNYDNTKNEINIINCYDKNNNYEYDIKISNYTIIKKIDNNIYIVKVNIIKYINNNAIRNHAFFNSKYKCYKYYITYYINYYIIIYNNINKNCNSKLQNYNTIFCNYSRNFMLFI